MWLIFRYLQVKNAVNESSRVAYYLPKCKIKHNFTN